MSVSPEATTQEVSHEATLFAEPILHFGSFTVTNSLIMSWLTVIILVVFFVAVGKKIRKVPSGVQNIFEFLLEEALKLADSITGERKKSEKFLPIGLALFLFVLVNNWLGLLPGVGTIGFIESGEHGQVFVPLLRGGTADANTTLTLALFAVISTHVAGVLAIGFRKHLGKFINYKAILEIPRKFRQDFMVVVVNPIKAFVGLIEVIGEVSKVASLTLRLFGNIFAGEVLLAAMMSITAFLFPLPFIFLEILVGVIQALIISILTMVFMSMMTVVEEH